MNSLEIELRCKFGLFEKQKKVIDPVMKPMRYQKKNKLPMLNSSDLDRGGDLSDDDDEEEAVDEEYETLEERNQRILEEDTKLVREMLAAEGLNCYPSPEMNPVTNDERCQEDDEQRDGFEVLEEEEDWSILDENDDRDDQWTFATENHGTFLKAVVNGDAPVEIPSATKIAQTKVLTTRKTKQKATDEHLDFEGEYLAFKGDGIQGRARSSRRHRKGRG